MAHTTIYLASVMGGQHATNNNIKNRSHISGAYQWPATTNQLCTSVLENTLFCTVNGKPKIYDRAMTALVHCYLLGGIAFGEDQLWVPF
jgi:hypothetical protein